MINKYWDLANVQLVQQEAIAPGDLIAYGVPTQPDPNGPVYA